MVIEWEFISSGSSTGSSSIPHSFSVDEIQKMRVKLKSSKSYPNDLLRQEAQTPPANGVSGNRIELIEEGDNSSSGVSSDQEITITGPADIKPMSELRKPVSLQIQETLKATAPIKAVAAAQKTSIPPKIISVESVEQRSDDDDSPSPPAKGFQRHNSLTRKQAATIAMNRAIQSRVAVSLVKLPPPIEADVEVDGSAAAILSSTVKPSSVVGRQQAAAENIVLAPPPQFCDCVNAAEMTASVGNGQQAATATTNNSSRGVRIVGALPKVNKMLGH